MKLRHTSASLRVEKSKRMEPLAEGLIPLDKRGRRNWHLMSNDEIVSFAQKFIDNNKIKSRVELQKVDGALDNILRKRKLFDKVVKKKRMNWASMNNDKVVNYAKRFIKNKKIKSRKELSKVNSGLYHVLTKRKLIDRVIPESRQHKDWASMNDDKIVSFAQEYIQMMRIKFRNELVKVNESLYAILRKRKLIDRLEFAEKRRNWSIPHDKLVIHAQNLIAENKIKNKMGLMKADYRLYQALRNRKLLKRLKFEYNLRDWKSMSDKKLVSYAQEFIKQKKIKNRKDLANEDAGLYQILRIRKLLDRVFSDVEKTVLHTGIREIIDALAEFRGAAA